MIATKSEKLSFDPIFWNVIPYQEPSFQESNNTITPTINSLSNFANVLQIFVECSNWLNWALAQP